MIKVPVGLVPSKGHEEESVPYFLSPSFWWFSDDFCHTLACRSITSIFAFIFTWSFPVCVKVPNYPLLKGHQSYWIIILTCLPQYKPYF